MEADFGMSQTNRTLKAAAPHEKSEMTVQQGDHVLEDQAQRRHAVDQGGPQSTQFTKLEVRSLSMNSHENWLMDGSVYQAQHIHTYVRMYVHACVRT